MGIDKRPPYTFQYKENGHFSIILKFIRINDGTSPLSSI